MKKFDVLIVGSGLAGVSTALELSKDYRIGLVTKKSYKIQTPILPKVELMS